MFTDRFAVISSLLLMLLGLIGPVDVTGQKKAKDRPLVSDPGSACDTTSWKLVFHDEFDGTALDRSKWITYYPFSSDGSDKCEACRYMGGTNSIYTDDQVSVGDGLLELGIESRPVEWYTKKTDFAASTIRSIGTAQFNYGKFETRCQLPEGKGLWPAFWMFGGQTEIDVFEVCGEKPKWIKGSLHRWSDPRYSNTGKYKGEDHSESFHVFAVEWERDELRWYVDGEQIYSRGRFTDKRGTPLPGCDRDPGEQRLAPYFPRSEDKVNVIAGNGVSEFKGYCKGPSGPTTWTGNTSMVVDWIRVYQREPQQDLFDLCTVPRELSVVGGSHQMKAQEERMIEVLGPHGSLFWEVGTGLRIADQSEHSITVKTSGTEGPTWVRATTQDDPCPRGAISLETEIKISR